MIRTLSLALALSACAAFRRGAQSLKNRDAFRTRHKNRTSQSSSLAEPFNHLNGAQGFLRWCRNNPDWVAQLCEPRRCAGPMKILAITATLLVWCTSVGAHQPGDEFADWYHSLRIPGLDPVKLLNPTESWCCSPDRDCKTVDYQTDAAGSYWIVADGERVQIPPDKILQRTDNPTGRAVACWNYYNGHPHVRCFVRPPES
jgi:hypothetical protein